ncbi:MAG TPA: class I SAM-dependent methyltransferase [Actinomycetota bacterium]|jgi:tRNA (cmo5U34)-methyltransferase|nr:class I SAM-dependent methyltransferase [Actinomycetota bacterium]
MTWDPNTYPTTIRAEIHHYEELQDQVAQATAGISARTILDLGVGAGETASRVLKMHPAARLIGIDSSTEMLRGAAQRLPQDRVELLQQNLAAPLPDQAFDLAISALAVHHLAGEDKAKLFLDLARHIRHDGYLVIGDVVIPSNPADALIEIEADYDFPSSIDDQLGWMEEAGFLPRVVWVCQDLAVFRAQLSGAK